MKRPSIPSRVGRQFLWWAIRLTWTAITITPLGPLRSLGRVLGDISFYALRSRRRTGLDNLRLAFPKEGEAWRRGVLRGVMRNFTRWALEVLYFARAPHKLTDEVIKIEGRENLERALGQGKGVIALGAHLGNFILGLMKLGQEGYPLNVVVRNPKFEPLTSFLVRLRKNLRIGEIPDRPAEACIRRCLEALRRKEILFLQIDIHGGGDIVHVDFFGQEVPTFKGPAVLALRTGAPVLPFFTVSDPKGGHRILIYPAIDFVTSGERDKDVHLLTALLTKCIEDSVREHPEQWLWIHQRFRKARKKPS